MNSLKAIISTIIFSLTGIAGASAGASNLSGVTSSDSQVLASRVIDDLLATKKHMYYGNSGCTTRKPARRSEPSVSRTNTTITQIPPRQTKAARS